MVLLRLIHWNDNLFSRCTIPPKLIGQTCRLNDTCHCPVILSELVILLLTSSSQCVHQCGHPTAYEQGIFHACRSPGLRKKKHEVAVLPFRVIVDTGSPTETTKVAGCH